MRSGTSRKAKGSNKAQAQCDAIACDCIAVRVRMLNRAITKLYDDCLRSLGMTISQLNILVVAAKLDVARPADVCNILSMDASTLSRNLERMKANGWLETVAGDDARAQPFRVTLAGKRLIEDASVPWSQAQHKARELLGETFVESLHQTAHKLGMPHTGA